MSTLTLMRLYLRHQSLPRLPLPCIGNAGILYSGPLIDRYRSVLMDESVKTTATGELAGTSKILGKKGSIGSLFFRRYSTSVDDIKKAEKVRLDKNKFKLKTLETVKVMVVTDTGSLTGMTLQEANKLAKKKGMNLVHITNPKEKPIQTEKEIYKLVSRLAEVEEEGVEAEEGDFSAGATPSKQKEVKTVLLRSNTGEHDVNSKLKSMAKWIQKGHRIRVIISQAADKGSAESIFKTIETQMKEVEGQIQQKITKGNDLRFYIGPPKKLKTQPTPAPPSKSKQKANKEKTSDNKDSDDSDDDDDQVDDKKKQASR